MLIVILAAVTWMYLVEAVKKWRRWPDAYLRVCALFGAVVIGLAVQSALMGWLALVTEQLAYDLAVHPIHLRRDHIRAQQKIQATLYRGPYGGLS